MLSDGSSGWAHRHWLALFGLIFWAFMDNPLCQWGAAWPNLRASERGYLAADFWERPVHPVTPDGSGFGRVCADGGRWMARDDLARPRCQLCNL